MENMFTTEPYCNSDYCDMGIKKYSVLPKSYMEHLCDRQYRYILSIA